MVTNPFHSFGRTLKLVGLLLLALSLGGSARSQQAEPTQPDPQVDFTFRVPVDVVVVRAIVTDRGKPVTDLTVEDFTVFEDGKALPIQSFTRESYEVVRSHEHEIEREKAPADGSKGNRGRLRLPLLPRVGLTSSAC